MAGFFYFRNIILRLIPYRSTLPAQPNQRASLGKRGTATAAHPQNRSYPFRAILSFRQLNFTRFAGPWPLDREPQARALPGTCLLLQVQNVNMTENSTLLPSIILDLILQRQIQRRFFTMGNRSFYSQILRELYNLLLQCSSFYVGLRLL